MVYVKTIHSPANAKQDNNKATSASNIFTGPVLRTAQMRNADPTVDIQLWILAPHSHTDASVTTIYKHPTGGKVTRVQGQRFICHVRHVRQTTSLLFSSRDESVFCVFLDRDNSACFQHTSFAKL